MATLRDDLRYALRQLRNSSGFTAVVELTLALGIGVNAIIFGLAYTAFLRSLPFSHADRLVHIWTIETDGDMHTPTPQRYLNIRDGSNSYEQIAATGWADYFYQVFWSRFSQQRCTKHSPMVTELFLRFLRETGARLAKRLASVHLGHIHLLCFQ